MVKTYSDKELSDNFVFKSFKDENNIERKLTQKQYEDLGYYTNLDLRASCSNPKKLKGEKTKQEMIDGGDIKLVDNAVYEAKIGKKIKMVVEK